LHEHAAVVLGVMVLVIELVGELEDGLGVIQ
jgi:hypothetical protein